MRGLAAEGRACGGGRWTALGSGPRGAAESADAQRWTARASAAGESADAQRPQAVQGRRPARAAPRRGRPSRLRLGPLARPRLEAAPQRPPARPGTKRWRAPLFCAPGGGFHAATRFAQPNSSPPGRTTLQVAAWPPVPPSFQAANRWAAATLAIQGRALCVPPSFQAANRWASGTRRAESEPPPVPPSFQAANRRAAATLVVERAPCVYRRPRRRIDRPPFRPSPRRRALWRSLQARPSAASLSSPLDTPPATGVYSLHPRLPGWERVLSVTAQRR